MYKIFEFHLSRNLSIQTDCIRQHSTKNVKKTYGLDKKDNLFNNSVDIIGILVIDEIHSIIGAGAVVIKDVPAYSVVAGNPAKVIKMLNPETWGGKISISAFSRFVA